MEKVVPVPEMCRMESSEKFSLTCQPCLKQEFESLMFQCVELHN
jgi:hypothetical protein